jgi:hypothetical protein
VQARDGYVYARQKAEGGEDGGRQKKESEAPPRRLDGIR